MSCASADGLSGLLISHTACDEGIASRMRSQAAAMLDVLSSRRGQSEQMLMSATGNRARLTRTRLDIDPTTDDGRQASIVDSLGYTNVWTRLNMRDTALSKRSSKLIATLEYTRAANVPKSAPR
jgi:hypothetical protein